MDRETGRIHDMESAEFMRRVEKAPEIRQRMMEMLVPPTEKQMARRPPKVGRNETCPCGSGMKFKKCCLLVPLKGRLEDREND